MVRLANPVEYTEYFLWVFSEMFQWLWDVWCCKEVSKRHSTSFCFPAVTVGKKRKAVEDEEPAQATKLTSKEVYTVLPALSIFLIP